MRVLIIAASFPPMHGAQPYQIEKVCKFLSKYGVELYVIACGSKLRQCEQDEIQKRVNYNLEFINVPDLSHRLFKRFSGFLETYATILSFRYRWFLGSAIRKAIIIINAFNPDIMLTVHYPIVAHIVGIAIKNRFNGLPWISFFSDPWPRRALPTPYSGKWAYEMLGFERTYLRNIIRKSDAIAVTSRFAWPYFERTARLNLEDRTICLPHCGGEAIDTAHQELEDFNCNDRWLFHAGTLTGPRSCPELLRAVCRVASDHQAHFKGLLIAGEETDGGTMRLARQLGAGKYVKCLGNLPQSVVMYLHRMATCNLVVEANMLESPFLPSKFADCAVTHKPILAISPSKSEIRSLFSEYGGGLATAYDEEEIARSIEKIFLYDECLPQREHGLAHYFSGYNVAKAYSEMFYQVLRK